MGIGQWIRICRLFRLGRLAHMMAPRDEESDQRELIEEDKGQTGDRPELVEGAIVLYQTMKITLPELLVPGCFLVLILVFFSCAIWFVEGGTYQEETGEFMIPDSYCLSLPGAINASRHGGDAGCRDVPTPFISIPDSAWWTLVTLTTVGYGDVSPSTRAGKAVASLLFVTAAVFMSMPLAIVGNNFTRAKTGEGGGVATPRAARAAVVLDAERENKERKER
eukprot:gene8756-10525_t